MPTTAFLEAAVTCSTLATFHGHSSLPLYTYQTICFASRGQILIVFYTCHEFTRQIFSEFLLRSEKSLASTERNLYQSSNDFIKKKLPNFLHVYQTTRLLVVSLLIAASLNTHLPISHPLLHHLKTYLYST